MFGDMVDIIEEKFLNLDTSKLDALFDDYGRAYGASAEGYARKTYAKWQSWEVTLSGQTAERLLELLPRHLTADERFHLIRFLRQLYFKKQTESVRITTENNWQATVMQAVDNVIAASRCFSLPEVLSSKATWLAGGDAKAAQRLLQAAEEEEARLRSSYLNAEFKRIQLLLQNLDHARHVSHDISLPQGDIHVSIEINQPTAMQRLFKGGQVNNNNSHALVSQEDVARSLERQHRTGNLLDLATSELTDSERRNIAKRIVDEKLSLDVSERKADQRFFDSSRDMANTVHAVNALEKSTKSDYDIRSRHETASGVTDIHVKKNSNTMIVVVAVVIGVMHFRVDLVAGRNRRSSSVGSTC